MDGRGNVARVFCVTSAKDREEAFRIFARKIGDAFSRYLNDLNFEVTERILQHKAFGKQVLFSW